MIVSMRGCARCHGDGHKDLDFKRFANAVELDNNEQGFTHWAMCPTLNEPILLRMILEVRSEQAPVKVRD